MMLDSKTLSSNVNFLLKMNASDSLVAADENGRLKITASKKKQGLFSTFFFREEKRVETVVNQTCQQLFDEIIKKNPSSLTSHSMPLKKERVKIKNILSAVSKIGQEILNPQLKADLHELVNTPETLEARLALRQGINPQVLNQTISGTYVMHNRQGEPWGIFKPQRQEVGGDKNPNWVVWAACRAEEWGIDSGTGYLRECAAYRLDEQSFCEVPLTVSTQFQHRTLDTSLIPLFTPHLLGSFQLFKDNCRAGNASLKTYEIYPIKQPKSLPKWLENILDKVITIVFRCLFYCGIPHLPTDQIHKMGILDIRLLNCDRHLGNFLVENGSKKIYPIDHGLILPDSAHRLRFDWKSLIQARIPFSKKSLNYIQKLDPQRDEQVLRECGINSINAIERMKLSTTLLQVAASRGLTLYQISDLMLQKKYFETTICNNVLKEGRDPLSVINQAINDYCI